MRLSILSLLATSALLAAACSSSTSTTNETADSTATAIEQTTEPATTTESTATENVDDANRDGGYFSVTLGSEKANIKTKYMDNGLSIDADNNLVYIIAGEAQTGNSISIDLKVERKGDFPIPISTENKKSANVNINLTTSAGAVSGALTEGTLTITEFDESGKAVGNFKGKTADGKNVEGEFKLNLKRQ